MDFVLDNQHVVPARDGGDRLLSRCRQDDARRVLHGRDHVQRADRARAAEMLQAVRIQARVIGWRWRDSQAQELGSNLHTGVGVRFACDLVPRSRDGGKCDQDGVLRAGGHDHRVGRALHPLGAQPKGGRLPMLR